MSVRASPRDHQEAAQRRWRRRAVTVHQRRRHGAHLASSSSGSGSGGGQATRTHQERPGRARSEHLPRRTGAGSGGPGRRLTANCLSVSLPETLSRTAGFNADLNDENSIALRECKMSANDKMTKNGLTDLSLSDRVSGEGTAIGCVCYPSVRSFVSNLLYQLTSDLDFYRAMLCIRGTSHGPVSVSVTSRCSTKTAKRRITQTTPHDTPGTLVF